MPISVVFHDLGMSCLLWILNKQTNKGVHDSSTQKLSQNTFQTVFNSPDD